MKELRSGLLEEWLEDGGRRLLTQSIIVLVNMMNHRFREPDLSSPVDSAAPTLPAGYSPPMPMPTFQDDVNIACLADRQGKPSVGSSEMEVLLTKKRQAARMLNMPTASPL